MDRKRFCRVTTALTVVAVACASFTFANDPGPSFKSNYFYCFVSSRADVVVLSNSSMIDLTLSVFEFDLFWCHLALYFDIVLL